MKAIIAILGLALVAGRAISAPITFDFKDPKGVNNIVFKTDAPLESINGTGNGISGKVVFDPQNPAATSGKIVLQSSSLHVGNPMMKEHMHGSMWMDVKNHPEITFELGSLKNVKTSGDLTSADAVGKLTMKGVTHDITTPVKITFLKDKLKARSMKAGDLLVIRSSFTVKRSDYGINASQGEDKVSNDIEISLSVAGSAPRDT